MKTNSLFFSSILLFLYVPPLAGSNTTLLIKTSVTDAAPARVLHRRASSAIAIDALLWTTPQQEPVIYTQSPDTPCSQTDSNVDDYADQPIPPVSKSTPRWLAPLVTLGVVAIWLMYRMLRFYNYRFPQLFSSHSSAQSASGSSAGLFSSL